MRKRNTPSLQAQPGHFEICCFLTAEGARFELLREGGISKEMAALADRIAKRKVMLNFNGLDPLTVGKATIDTLNKSISTGVGYAYATRFLADYMAKHLEITRGD